MTSRGKGKSNSAAKRTWWGLLFLLGVLLGSEVPKYVRRSSRGVRSAGDIEAFFSPKGGCTAHIVEAVAKANKEIDIFIFSCSSDAIVQALCEAKQRGVRVRIIADSNQAAGKYSKIGNLASVVDEVYIDSRAGNAHHKFMVIDGESVLTGSFNYSKNAEQYNRENLLHIHEPAIAVKYRQAWEQSVKDKRVVRYGDLN